MVRGARDCATLSWLRRRRAPAPQERFLRMPMSPHRISPLDAGSADEIRNAKKHQIDAYARTVLGDGRCGPHRRDRAVRRNRTTARNWRWRCKTPHAIRPDARSGSRIRRTGAPIVLPDYRTGEEGLPVAGQNPFTTVPDSRALLERRAKGRKAAWANLRRRGGNGSNPARFSAATGSRGGFTISLKSSTVHAGSEKGARQLHPRA